MKITQSQPCQAKPIVSILHPDTITGRLTAQVLNLVDINAATYQSPSTLLEHIPQSPPDCILMDFLLPEMSCFQAMHALHKIGCFAPVILMSNRIEQAMLIKAMNQRSFGFIKRPFEQMDLIEIVQSAIAEHKRQQPFLETYFNHEKELGNLTGREREIYELLVQNLTAKQISDRLGISFRTVEHHRKKVFDKLGISTTGQLIRTHAISEAAHAFLIHH